MAERISSSQTRATLHGGDAETPVAKQKNDKKQYNLQTVIAQKVNEGPHAEQPEFGARR
jgi:hypothetical protein